MDWSLQEIIERHGRTLKHPKAIPYVQPLSIRQREEPEDPSASVFQVDKERIRSSKAFRRLKHKTQIIWAPKDAHIRTRMTHTEEVADVAFRISNALGLNTELTLAIAYGHDIGHPPFGHAGERALNDFLRNRERKPFTHHEQAVRILQEQEKLSIRGQEFRGLNLTKLVVDGIRNCSRLSATPSTLEARVVAFVDDFTYTASDYEEILKVRGKISSSLRQAIGSLGKTPSERLALCVKDICDNSNDDEIKISDDLSTTLELIRQSEGELFISDDMWANRERGAQIVITELMNYFCPEEMEKWNGNHLDIVEAAIRKVVGRSDEPVTVIDNLRHSAEDYIEVFTNYLARMTDTFALDLYRRIFSPETLDYFL